MKPALIIGNTCVDIIINIPHLPVTQEDIHPTAQTMTIGGCPHNVAHILRLFGAPHTHITPVGSGMYGDYVANYMERSGIPITVRVPEKENGCCYCLVEATGERTFMSYHGVEYSFQKEWMKPYHADDYGLVYICGLEIEEPTGDNLLEYLEEHPNLSIFYAPGPRLLSIDPKKQARILEMHPILHINELEALALSQKQTIEEAAAHLHSITGNSVIITLGEQGTYVLEQSGEPYLCPPVPAKQIVDTIGAGDSHAGTIIACLTLDMPLKEAVAQANRVASAVVGVQGIALPPEICSTLFSK